MCVCIKVVKLLSPLADDFTSGALFRAKLIIWMYIYIIFSFLGNILFIITIIVYYTCYLLLIFIYAYMFIIYS